MSAEPLSSEIHLSGERLLPPQNVHHGLLSQVEVIGIREGGLVDCWVPTELIDHEEVPVKEEWVESLAADMRAITERDGGSGQLTPIILGEIDGEETFKIIDGFHRDAGLKRNGEERIYATVKQTDWDELFDLRIFTAKDHAHVRFSRVVSWIREVWALTDISQHLTVEQAVLLYRFDTDGSKLDLTPDVVGRAKAWVQRKEEQWQMKAMTIHSHLKVAEHVDPALVHSTREKKDSRNLDAPTQAIIKIFSKELPDNYPMQNLVMQVAMERNLGGPYVKALCKKVAGFETLEEAKNFIATINWDVWVPEYSEGTQRSLRRAYDPRHKGAAVLANAKTTIESVVERVELSFTRDEDVTPDMVESLLEAQERVNELMVALGSLSTRLVQLRNRASDTVKETASIGHKKSKKTDVVEPVQNTTNVERHERWGLAFKVYEGEAPAVSVKGKTQYDLSDEASALLYAAAEEVPGTRLDMDRIITKLKEAGIGGKEGVDDSTVRKAIREVNELMKRFGVDKHLIMIFGGQRNVIFGLMD